MHKLHGERVHLELQYWPNMPEAADEKPGCTITIEVWKAP